MVFFHSFAGRYDFQQCVGALGAATALARHDTDTLSRCRRLHVSYCETATSHSTRSVLCYVEVHFGQNMPVDIHCGIGHCINYGLVVLCWSTIDN